MPSGAAAIRRPGKRGVAWAIKYRDAAGRQVWETLGREPEWSEARAQRELGKRLQAVEPDRWRKPERTTFATFAERWEADYLPGRNLKPSTASDYRSIVRAHLAMRAGRLSATKAERIKTQHREPHRLYWRAYEKARALRKAHGA